MAVRHAVRTGVRSVSTSTARKRSMSGTRPESRRAERRSRTRRAIAKAALASSTLLICAIPTATSSADFTVRRSERRAFIGEQVARGAAARRAPCLDRDVDRHDLLDLPAAAGGGGRETAGPLVPVGPDLHPRQRDGEG